MTWSLRGKKEPSRNRWPEFLVIGAYKSGTTALHHALRQHPMLYLPRKEVNYFAFADGAGRQRPVTRSSVLNTNDYLALFRDADPQAIVGESSPEYMANPAAFPRIVATLPTVRMIAVLRNPVERAYSDYLMYRRDGDEREPRFADALDRQGERSARRHVTGYYLSTGFYGAQLRPFFEWFPREQLHVLLYEDLQTDFAQTLAGIFNFIGVDPTFTPTDQEPVNISGLPATPLVAAALEIRHRLRRVLRPLPESVKRRVNRPVERRLYKPSLDDHDRARLIDIYHSDIDELGKLLKRDLSHWLKD